MVTKGADVGLKSKKKVLPHPSPVSDFLEKRREARKSFPPSGDCSGFIDDALYGIVLG